jgi:hypothetical protein
MKQPRSDSINDVNEVHAVLLERVEQWNQQLVELGRLMGRAEGREEGLEKGLAKGRLEGESRVLARLLARRFGPSPGWADERLTGASEAELAAWTDAALGAGGLEAVFAAPPASH